MLPLHDDLPTRIRPWVNWALILANIGIHIWLIGKPDADQVRIVEQYGAIPARLMADGAPAGWLTLLTSTFLHGGWLHLGGNMLFLWIFGNNVEDRLGHLRYLGFYLACGVIASLAQVLSGPESTVPGIGASGAIAGVLAAYVLWFGRARITVLVPIVILPWILRLPALFVIGLWFVVQLGQGFAALEPGIGGASVGGVAWWAHIGGFVAGLLVAPVLAPRRR